uniref:FXNA-like protease n=1 Tax=Meloidogyne incognita TaxID=6306 RepID=A0A914NKC2_MELIC
MAAEQGQLRSRRSVVRPTEYLSSEFNDELISENEQKKIPYHLLSGQLGFFHWLFVFAMLAALYGLVVLLDLKMPDVKPADQYEHFSEMRARQFLTQIANLGPRPSGSEALEIHAFRIITEKINSLKEVAERNDVNRIEMDIQRPTGCYDLKFLSVFTLCYHKVTNIVARIGPKKGPTDFSILINCHFDTLPDTPGATDNAVSCAIMMEILEVFAHLNEPLEHDILFLFNGAEENFLQASHGFIVNHPWRHSLRAFINLEGCGSGGRELLFQTGPGESWLIKTYLDNAPHPHCNVLGQEIFQLGIIPSDTDFRIFRDYGKISGFDIAYIRNGWVYHTEFDRPELIDIGAIQRSGDNILALSRALIRSPYLKQPANFNEGTKWVFLDVVGLFTIFYEMKLALIFNYTVLVLVLFRIYLHLFRNGDYSINVLLCASMNQFMAFGAMLFIGICLVLIISLLNMTMSWYSMPELVFPLYIVPMMTAAFFAHARSAGKMELFFLYLLGFIQLALIYLCFMFYFHSFVILYCQFQKFFGFIKVITPKSLFWAQSICLTPLIILISTYTQLLFDFFVPVMGRFGNTINPEIFIMSFSLLVSLTFVLFTNNLIYVSRRLGFMVKCMIAVSLFCFLIISTTNVGVPYKYSKESPRLRRVIALHAKKSVFKFDGNLLNSETGLFVQALDYRGADDLPEHTFLQGVGKPDCSNTTDEYCQMPYYTAIHQLFPPDRSRWVPLPTEPPIARPLNVKLLDENFFQIICLI